RTSTAGVERSYLLSGHITDGAAGTAVELEWHYPHRRVSIFCQCWISEAFIPPEEVRRGLLSIGHVNLSRFGIRRRTGPCRISQSSRCLGIRIEGNQCLSADGLNTRLGASEGG